ncbi:MAG: ferritin-like domain-containing protein [Myxococcota bacterium]
MSDLPNRHPARTEGVKASMEAIYNWNYEPEVDELRTLYANGLERQWIAMRDLDWERGVDRQAFAETFSLGGLPISETRFWKSLPDDTRWEVARRSACFMLSNFLHGEQGALITASQLVGAVPWIDAKHYAATQTMDEARHVEVFGRYLEEKLEWEWPINQNLKRLLDIILLDGRWDFKYLGMQILVEGLAMAAFSNMHQLAQEPLLKSLVHNVMRDESRHVAFGVLSLKGYYDEMNPAELREREDFVVEACLLMRDRLVGDEIADVMDFDRGEVREIMLASPVMQLFRQGLFARVVPNLKRLGLLTDRVRGEFEKMGILQFEDLDPEAADRALGL